MLGAVNCGILKHICAGTWSPLVRPSSTRRFAGIEIRRPPRRPPLAAYPRQAELTSPAGAVDDDFAFEYPPCCRGRDELADSPHRTAARSRPCDCPGIWRNRPIAQQRPRCVVRKGRIEGSGVVLELKRQKPPNKVRRRVAVVAAVVAAVAMAAAVVVVVVLVVVVVVVVLVLVVVAVA